jgi:hypothetical protein
VDATGLEARHVSAYFRMRRGEAKRPGRRRRAWPKLTVALHTHSHLILGAVTGTGPAQDSPDFAPAMRQAAALVALDTALADAGYDAEHNHRLCREELGLRRSVIALNPRNTGRRWPKTPYRRAMRRRFPRALRAVPPALACGERLQPAQTAPRLRPHRPQHRCAAARTRAPGPRPQPDAAQVARSRISTEHDTL